MNQIHMVLNTSSHIVCIFHVSALALKKLQNTVVYLKCCKAFQ